MCYYKIAERKIVTIEAAFKPGDQFEPWCALVHLPDPWVCEVAYGATEQEAVAALMHKESVQQFKQCEAEEAANR